MSCILDAVRHGRPMPGLAEDLLQIVRGPDRAHFVRVRALEAFSHVAPGSHAELRALLDDIHAGRVDDTERELRGSLLSGLYPHHVSPVEVVDYLIEPHPNFIGAYVMFVEDTLVSRTSSRDLPGMLDALSTRGPLRFGRYRRTWSRLVGRLLLDGLRDHGDVVASEQLFRWFGLSLDEHRSPIVECSASLCPRRFRARCLTQA